MDDRKVTEEEIAEHRRSLQNNEMYQGIKFATEMLMVKLAGKPIPEFEDYWVTPVGDVYHIWESTKKINLLKPHMVHGHLQVGLCRDGKRYMKYTHVLVAEAFVPKPPELIAETNLAVHHVDHNKTNNVDSNLVWMSRAEHCRLHSSRKIYCETTDEFFDSVAEAAKAYGINASNISKVCRGERKTAGGYHFKYVED